MEKFVFSGTSVSQVLLANAQLWGHPLGMEETPAVRREGARITQRGGLGGPAPRTPPGVTWCGVWGAGLGEHVVGEGRPDAVAVGVHGVVSVHVHVHVDGVQGDVTRVHGAVAGVQLCWGMRGTQLSSRCWVGGSTWAQPSSCPPLSRAVGDTGAICHPLPQKLRAQRGAEGRSSRGAERPHAGQAAAGELPESI